MINLKRVLSLFQVVVPGSAPGANPQLSLPAIDANGSVIVRALINGGVDSPTGRDYNSNTLPNLPIGQDVMAFLFALDATGANANRLQTLLDNANAQANSMLGLLGVASRAQLFNGTTWDQIGAASAAKQSAATQVGIQAVASVGNWSVSADPAVNVAASATRAAGAAGVRHICTSIAASLSAGATASGIVKVYLRDGAAGVGPVLWSANLVVPIGGAANINLSGLSIVGSAAAAMTLEFSAAGGATTQENVTLTGYSVA